MLDPGVIIVAIIPLVMYMVLPGVITRLILRKFMKNAVGVNPSAVDQLFQKFKW